MKPYKEPRRETRTDDSKNKAKTRVRGETSGEGRWLHQLGCAEGNSCAPYGFLTVHERERMTRSQAGSAFHQAAHAGELGGPAALGKAGALPVIRAVTVEAVSRCCVLPTELAESTQCHGKVVVGTWDVGLQVNSAPLGVEVHVAAP